MDAFHRRAQRFVGDEPVANARVERDRDGGRQQSARIRKPRPADDDFGQAHERTLIRLVADDEDDRHRPGQQSPRDEAEKSPEAASSH